MLQDAAPAAGQANERRTVAEERRRGPDDRRRAPHDDVSDRRRGTEDAGPLANAGPADAAPQVQTTTVKASSRNTFALLQLLTQYCLYCWAMLRHLLGIWSKAKLAFFGACSLSIICLIPVSFAHECL